jgi:hypothetical protein
MNFYIVNQQGSFGCRRDENTRTLIYCDDVEVERFASQCPADQIVIILNDAEFCGTASFYARACNGWNLEQVATHEFGHTFGGLGDEYSYSSAYPEYKAIAAAYPNCDSEGCGKWQTITGTGCFAGCGVDDLYRATRNNCIMKRYVNMFCPVCNEHIEDLFANYQQGEAAVMAAPPLEKTYMIDLSYESGNLSFKDIYVTESMAPDKKIKKKTDYTAKLISFDGVELYSVDFALPNIIFPPPPMNESEKGIPPIILENLTWSILAPQTDRAEKLEVFDKQKMLFSVDIGYLSNTCGNGICEKHESALECPADCKENTRDELCDYKKNGVCDADCKEIDPDCRTVNWFFASLIAVSVISILVIILSVRIKPRFP